MHVCNPMNASDLSFSKQKIIIWFHYHVIRFNIEYAMLTSLIMMVMKYNRYNWHFCAVEFAQKCFYGFCSLEHEWILYGRIQHSLQIKRIFGPDPEKEIHAPQQVLYHLPFASLYPQAIFGI